MNRLVKLGRIPADLSTLGPIDRLLLNAEDKIHIEAKRIEKEEDVTILYREGITVADILHCNIGITQIFNYFAPTFSELCKLGLRKRDLGIDKSLLNLTWLACNYGHDFVRGYFDIDISDIINYSLSSLDLESVSFHFGMEQCTCSNGSFVENNPMLGQMGLSPGECANLGMTLDMLRGLELNERSDQSSLVHTNWVIGDFREAFVPS